MKSISKILILAIAAALFVRCSKSDAPAATGSVSVKMSATSGGSQTLANGRLATGARISSSSDNDSTSGITFTDVMVNVRDLKFDFDERDRHFEEEKDSAYSEDDDAKLKGPFLVDLMNAGSFVDRVVTNVNLPNGIYDRVRFKLVPSTASGEMDGKSIMITGKIDTIPFIFWHKRDANFGAKISNQSDSTSNTSDSTALVVNGATVTLAIHLELDKIFDALDGVDLTKAVDGNKDGIITIDPNNDDGNKWIADRIMMLLVRHAHCEKRERH